MISFIVAIAHNNVIGKDNQLLWHISDDLKRFKTLTMGHPIVMGRKTYLSLPFRPLKGRRNIVISRTEQFEGTDAVHSIEEALQLINTLEHQEVFVIGGAEIYRQMLPYADRLYVTEVHHTFDGDTYFPTFDKDNWNIINETDIMHDETSNLDFKYITYEKR